MTLKRDPTETLVRTPTAESKQEQELAALRQRFDQRLASLETDDAGERLREVLHEPATRDVTIKAGEGY